MKFYEIKNFIHKILTLIIFFFIKNKIKRIIKTHSILFLLILANDCIFSTIILFFFKIFSLFNCSNSNKEYFFFKLNIASILSNKSHFSTKIL